MRKTRILLALACLVLAVAAAGAGWFAASRSAALAFSCGYVFGQKSILRLAPEAFGYVEQRVGIPSCYDIRQQAIAAGLTSARENDDAGVSCCDGGGGVPHLDLYRPDEHDRARMPAIFARGANPVRLVLR